MDETSLHPETVATLEALLERLADLLADKLAARDRSRDTPSAALPTRKLLTLDELVAQLPPGKKPGTWKAWLYQRTRHGTVPGCSKIGGRLFFNPEQTLPWLLNEAPPGGLDYQAGQSLHATPMHNRNESAR